MKILLQVVFIVALAAQCFAGVVDRVVAVVNKRTVTYSEWEEQERFTALLAGGSADQIMFSGASLDRLVDKILLVQQIESMHFAPATGDEAQAQLLRMRQQIPGAQSDEEWRKRLAAFALTGDEVLEHVREQMDILRFIDLRFRPSARVEPEAIDAYYANTLVPRLRQIGTPENELPSPGDTEVRERITRILVEQQIDTMLNSWLRGLRMQGDVRQIADRDEVADLRATPSSNQGGHK